MIDLKANLEILELRLSWLESLNGNGVEGASLSKDKKEVLDVNQLMAPNRLRKDEEVAEEI